MLLLAREHNNELTIRHARSGETVTLLYRDPTTEEVLKYHNSTTRRKGKRILSDIPANRLRGGLLVLTGIAEGQLGKPDGKGGILPVSSNPESAAYDEDWKTLVKKHLAPELMLLGIHVFEASSIEGEDDPDEDEDAEGN